MGTTPQQVLAAHVAEAPVPLSQRRDSVPAALESLIMRCLNKKPADRWQSADELLTPLEALTTPSGGVTPAETVSVTVRPERTRSRAWRRIAVSTAATVAVLAAGVVIGRMVLPTTEPELDRHRVAFVPLENRTGDASLDFVGRLVADGLSSSVTREQIAEVVPVARVAALLGDAAPDGSDRDMTVAHATGAGIVVGGAVYPDGERVRLQLTATDAVRQVPFVAIEPITASRDSLTQATDVVREQVSVLLLMMFDEELGAVAATQGYPTLEAYRAFQDGRDRFWELNFVVAINSLLRAAEMDSVIRPMALIMAQQGANTAGQSRLSDSLTAVLVGMRDGLPEYHRIYVDVLVALEDGDWERAYRSGRELDFLLAGNPAQKIWQAFLCLSTNRPREALDVLDGIDSLVGDSPARMWWVHRRRREAFFRLGAYDDALRASREMRSLNRDPALGWSDELVILAAAGRLAELEDEVGRYMAEAPAEAGVGRSLAKVGLALRLFGEERAGMDLLRRAVAWWESQPPSVMRVERLRYLQMETLYAAERWGEAFAQLQALLAERPGDLVGLAHLGLIAARQGNRVRADSVVELLEARDSAGNGVLPTYYRARIAAVLGERVEAVQLLRRAIDAGYNFFGYPFDQSTRWDFAPLRGYRPYQDLNEPKG
jgi:hypothetical protein